MMNFNEKIDMILNANFDEDTCIRLLQGVVDGERLREEKEKSKLSYGEENRKKIEEINKKHYEKEQKEKRDKSENDYKNEIKKMKDYLLKFYNEDVLKDFSDKEIEKTYYAKLGDKNLTLEKRYEEVFKDLDSFKDSKSEIQDAKKEEKPFNIMPGRPVVSINGNTNNLVDNENNYNDDFEIVLPEITDNMLNKQVDITDSMLNKQADIAVQTEVNDNSDMREEDAFAQNDVAETEQFNYQDYEDLLNKQAGIRR